MMTKSAAAFTATIPNILTIICSPLIGKLSDKIGSRKKILIVTMSALIPAVILMFSSNLVLVYVGAILLGVIGLGTPAMVLSTVGEAVEEPKLEGVGMGLLIGFQNLGMFLGTLFYFYTNSKYAWRQFFNGWTSFGSNWNCWFGMCDSRKIEIEYP